MKVEWNKKYATIAVYVLVTFIACTLFYTLVNKISYFRGVLSSVVKILTPFIYGLTFAYILCPILNWLEKTVFPFVLRNKVSANARRGWGVLLTMLFALTMIAVFFSIVIPQLVDSVIGIAGQTQKALPAAQKWLTEVVTSLNLSEQYIDQVVGWFSTSAEKILTTIYNFVTQSIPQVLNVTISITSGVLKFVIGLIISVYVLLSKEKFFAQTKKCLYAFFPKNFVAGVLKLTHDSHNIFSGFIVGKIIDSAIIGVLCFIGLNLIGTPYPLLISVVIGITNVIPYFGPFIGAIPSALFILLISPIDCVWFAIFILALQQLDGNIIGPKILGDSTGLSAFWVIFSITLFGGLMNFLGMLIGVPLFAVIYSVIRNFADYRLTFKGMTTQTAAYASQENPLLPEKQKSSFNFNFAKSKNTKQSTEGEHAAKKQRPTQEKEDKSGKEK